MRAKNLRYVVVLCALFVGFHVVSYLVTPRVFRSDVEGVLDLKNTIPEKFGDWQVDQFVGAIVVNPQQEEVLRRIYSETLSRTYISKSGARVMLSIAYGKDQRDGMQMHYPDVCYPAQGFRVESLSSADISVAGRVVPARRMSAALGSNRNEKITYWSVVGETSVRSGVDKKVAEMSHTFSGVIPDGLLFRVSSVGSDAAREYALQEQFLNQLFGSVDQGVIRRYLGRGV
ncbi:exosortase-associated protein EpsI, B-type [Roseateles sp. BYS180W]|uniref:Exosortase-associated protein EpsI, B-type n=1 Tax=Roseateles rivi TaxID=3299028 RepID=A0ABW7FSM0_9BURK